MADFIYSHSPIPSVEHTSTMDDSLPGFSLSDVSSLKSASSGSEHSLDKVPQNESEKKLRHVGYLIDEMRDTELTYINALTDVTEGYIDKIRASENTGFTEDVIREAFVNIEDVREFHINLHKDLVSCSNDHKQVAELFINRIDKFTEMYVEFCSAFPRSLEKLEELHETEPSKTFLTQCQAILNHIFPVEEYLHRAVQRVLKYPLLFRDMSKKLVDLDGHDRVEEALNKVLVTAVKINAVKRVQELQSTELVGWRGSDLSLMGDLLLEDTFKLAGAKDPRYLFLFKQCLLLTKRRDNETTFVFKNEVAMDNITLKEQVDGDFLKWSLFVGKGAESYTLQARDGEQKEAWTREVKRCIVFSTPGLTEVQKEALLMKLPSLKNDCEQIDRLWKRATKKHKEKGKSSDSVQIIHNADTALTESSDHTFGWSPSDSHEAHILSRHGKRKLKKKLSTTHVQISNPVGFISDGFTQRDKKAKLFDLRGNKHQASIKKHMSCPEMDQSLYNKDRASPLSLPDEELLHLTKEPSMFDSCTSSMTDSGASYLTDVSPDNLICGMDTSPDSAGSETPNTVQETPEFPPTCTSPSLAEILDYDVIKAKMLQNDNICRLDNQDYLPEHAPDADIFDSSDRQDELMVSDSPIQSSSSNSSPSIELISDKDAMSFEAESNLITGLPDVTIQFNNGLNSNNLEDLANCLVELDGCDEGAVAPIDGEETMPETPQIIITPRTETELTPRDEVIRSDDPLKTEGLTSDSNVLTTTLPQIIHTAPDAEVAPEMSPEMIEAPPETLSQTPLQTASETPPSTIPTMPHSTASSALPKSETPSEIPPQTASTDIPPQSTTETPNVAPGVLRSDVERPVSAVKPVQRIQRDLDSNSDESRQFGVFTKDGTFPRRTALKKRSPSDPGTISDQDLTYKSDITISEKTFDSDIDNVTSESDAPANTGVDLILGYISRCIVNSQHYPGNVLLLVYILSCVLYFLPMYFTVPSTAVLGYLVYRGMPDSPKNSDKHKKAQ